MATDLGMPTCEPLDSSSETDVLNPSGKVTARSRGQRRCGVATALLVAVAAALALLVALVRKPGASLTRTPGLAGLSVLSEESGVDAVGQKKKNHKRTGGRRDPQSLAECAIDSQIGTLYLGRAGLEIAGSVESCGEYHELQAELGEEAAKLLRMRKLEVLNNATRSPSEALMRAQDAWFKFQAWEQDGNLGRRLESSGLRGAVDTTPAHPRSAKVGHGEEASSAEHAKRSSHEDEPHASANEVDHFIKAAVDDDVLQRIAHLGHEGKEIGQLKRKSFGVRNICMADVAGTLASFSYVASYYSALVSECSSKIFFRAYCATDIAKMIGAIAEMLAGAAATSVQCTDLAEAVASEGEEDAERRLSEGGDSAGMLRDMFERLYEADQKKKKTKYQKQWTAAACSLDIPSAVLFLARFGLEVKGAQANCEEGFVEICGGQVSGMLAALLLVSQFLSNAVSECPNHFNIQAQCSASISALLAGIGELTSSAFLLADSCYHATVRPEGPKKEYVSSLKWEEDRERWVREYNGQILPPTEGFPHVPKGE